MIKNFINKKIDSEMDRKITNKRNFHWFRTPFCINDLQISNYQIAWQMQSLPADILSHHVLKGQSKVSPIDGERVTFKNNFICSTAIFMDYVSEFIF